MNCAAPLSELGPAFDLVTRGDDRGSLGRAGQVARDHQVELDARERVARGGRLLEAARRQRHRLGIDRRAGGVHVRHVGVPHQVEPAPHSYLAR